MSKYIKDPIYDKYIKYLKDELILLDNPWFKRLKKIKQLGSLDEVFPSASHTRAEHSIGVSHLAEDFLTSIYNNSKNIINRETKRIIRNTKIAGLYHDTGHGPFSHVFDDLVLKKLCPQNPDCEHERRSCNVFKYACSDLSANDYNGYDIDAIQNYIDPIDNTFNNTIISNKLNGLDVDKFDYIQRDTYHIGFKQTFNYSRLCNKVKLIDNTICYHDSVPNDLFDMFNTRYKLHREVYNHHAVKSIELMISDILCTSNEHYNFPSRISSKEFITLDDGILSNIKYNLDLKCCTKLIDRIERRELYKPIYKAHATSMEDVVDHIEDTYVDNNISDFHFVKLNLGFCNKNDNPINNIKFYNNDGIIEDNKKLDVYNLVPQNFSESNILVFSKK